MSRKGLRNWIRRQLFSLFYSRGDGFHCVFCGKSYSKGMSLGMHRSAFRKFDIVGAGKRKNSRCPNCRSKDRARLLLIYLRERTKLFVEPHRLLHIAPDPHLARELAEAQNIDYVCGGLSIDHLRELDPLKIDVTDIPFGDDEFDVVLCNHVLPYLPEDGKALSEIRRVLRPGGFAIIQVPIGLALKETYEVSDLEIDRESTVRHYGLGFNLRIYGQDYEERLRAAGFAVERHNAFLESWIPDPRRHGLDPREDVYVAIKSAGTTAQQVELRGTKSC